MKRKNKIISWVLLGALVQPSFSALKLEASASSGLGLSEDEQVVIGFSKTKAEIDNPELERENYTLTRVIKSGETSFACYEHKETKAQVVVDLDGTKKDKFEIMYRLPVLDNTGTNHILEHCVGHNMIFPISNAYVFRNTIAFISKSVNELNNGHFFESLKEKNFNEDIFVIERKRVDYELSALEYNQDFLNQYEFIFRDSFCSNGVVGEIENCTYESVCEAFDKYIHPSNSLMCIEGRSSEEMMRIAHEKYLKGVGERKIEVSVTSGLSQEVNYKEFEIGGAKYFECGGQDCKGKMAKYKASIIYDFGKLSVSAKDMAKLTDLFSNLFDSRLGLMLRDKNLYNCQVIIEPQHNVDKILQMNFCADNEKAITESNLREVSRMIFDFMDERINEISSDDLGKLKDCEQECLINSSFRQYGDPFSDEVFDIKDDEINWDSNLEKIKAIMKNENISTRIMSLKQVDKKEYYDKYWFLLPCLGKDNRNNKLLSALISKCIVVPELIRTGEGYFCEGNVMEGKGIFFGIGGDTGKLYKFSRERFLGMLKDFEITQDMLDVVIRDYSEQGKEDFSDITLENINKYFKDIVCRRLYDISNPCIRRYYVNGERSVLNKQVLFLKTSKNTDVDLVCAKILLDNIIAPDLQIITGNKVIVNTYLINGKDQKVGFEVWVPVSEFSKTNAYFSAKNGGYSKKLNNLRITQDMIDKAVQEMEVTNKPSISDLQQQKMYWKTLKN